MRLTFVDAFRRNFRKIKNHIKVHTIKYSLNTGAIFASPFLSSTVGSLLWWAINAAFQAFNCLFSVLWVFLNVSSSMIILSRGVIVATAATGSLESAFSNSFAISFEALWSPATGTAFGTSWIGTASIGLGEAFPSGFPSARLGTPRGWENNWFNKFQ